MSTDCLFCRILAGEEPSHEVWSDEHHVAVLTPFPNTPGFTVLLTRDHHTSYVADLPDEVYDRMWRAARHLAKRMDQALGTQRTAMVAEGMGINHAHIKLIPLHGLSADWKPVLSTDGVYTDTYSGFVTTADGPRRSDEQLQQMARRIREA